MCHRVVEMNILRTLFLVFIINELADYTAGQNLDIIWNTLRFRLNNNKLQVRIGVPTHDRPQVTKRRIDRFRFFHRGIGKRSALDGTELEQSSVPYKEHHLLNITDQGPDEFSQYVQDHVTSGFNFRLTDTRTFQEILALNYLFLKHSFGTLTDSSYLFNTKNQKAKMHR